MDYKLADLITTFVARIIDKDVQTPSLVEAYEFLFEDEKKRQDDIKAKNEMEIWKQRMINYAKDYNERRLNRC